MGLTRGRRRPQATARGPGLGYSGRVRPLDDPMTAPSTISKSRLEALCDGIYAVALTLLALDLKLPPLMDASGPALNAALAALLVKGLVWILSFWVAALFWMTQNRVLRDYAVLDGRAVRIELSQLALVTLLPFSTALIGEHGDLAAAALLYSTHLACLASLSVLRVARLLRWPGLRADGADVAALRWELRRTCALLACALVAMALAPWVPSWNMLAMLGLLLRRALPRPRGAPEAGR